MRTFEQLDTAEQKLAIEICIYELENLIRDGIISFPNDEALSTLISYTSDHLKFDEDIIEKLNFNEAFSTRVREMALEEAKDAEYPSKGSDGLYRKVIQLG